ncbi:hypothetical protein BDY24DRAFT_234858 [Mrakia frigida]|uniref:uncharacterized protein n=1 Tax=Mrakia frigida TaxID=29902 RepID=UPI003FCC1C2B
MASNERGAGAQRARAQGGPRTRTAVTAAVLSLISFSSTNSVNQETNESSMGKAGGGATRTRCRRSDVYSSRDGGRDRRGFHQPFFLWKSPRNRLGNGQQHLLHANLYIFCFRCSYSNFERKGSSSSSNTSGSSQPLPFDLTLNLNLTSACLEYFAYFLSSQSFQACRPFSFLFSSSSAFSSIASRDNLTDITAVVQATLNSSSSCESLMVGMGTSLGSRCQADLLAGVPIAKEALTGFQTFAMMKEASALVSSDSGAYCYVEALASDEPADLFLWNLYTGAALPNTNLPSCSSCTKDLFSVYETYASNASLALTVSYSSAVELSNTQCGSSFATTVVATSSGSRSFFTTRRSTITLTLLGLAALAHTL